MPTTRDRIRAYALAPSTVGTLVAIVLAIGAWYATEALLGPAEVSYLGLLVVGLGTPTTMENHDLLPDRPAAVVGRVAVACAGSLAVFSGLYLLVSRSLSPLPAAVVAFLVTAVASELVARQL